MTQNDKSQDFDIIKLLMMRERKGGRERERKRGGGRYIDR